MFATNIFMLRLNFIPEAQPPTLFIFQGGMLMFKLFKKTPVTTEVITPIAPEKVIETVIESQEEQKEQTEVTSVLPTAEEMANLSSREWAVATTDMILEEIYREARNGKRYISLFRTILPENIAEDLKNQGFKVEISELYQAPYFKVFW